MSCSYDIHIFISFAYHPKTTAPCSYLHDHWDPGPSGFQVMGLGPRSAGHAFFERKNGGSKPLGNLGPLILKADTPYTPWVRGSGNETVMKGWLMFTWVFPKNRGIPKWMVYNGKPY